jgi:flagellar biogenesis protein FliO
MASIIRIKRSQVSGNPNTLAAGELAYSALSDNGSNGGDRLYIGIGTETNGNAANHLVIGGKFFTDRLDHTAGVLTADSALVVDGDSKLDRLNVDNIRLDGNTISSTNTNGDITLDPAGTGVVRVEGDLTVTGTINATITGSSDAANRWTTPRDLSLTGDATATLEDVDGSGDVSATLTLATVNSIVGQFGSSTEIPVITVNGKGLVTAVSTQSISTSLNIAADSGTPDSVDLGVDTLSIVGGEGIGTSVTNNTITISAEDASSSNKGVASFNDTDFSVSSGAVSLSTSINSDIGSFGSSTAIPVITVNAKGLVTAVTTESINTSFNINGDTGTDVFNTGSTLTFIGTDPVQTAVADDSVTISVDDATTSSKGIAQFSSDNFAVSSGVVTIKDGGIANAELVNSSVTIGSTEISLGGTQTSIDGLTELTVDNININGATISATGESADISVTLDPKGAGSVDVNGARITNVGDPTQATDAATKSYVDAVAEGLHVHAAVDAATTNTLAVLTGGQVTYNNGTDGVGATLTLELGLTTLDGYTLANGDRILVKNESTLAHNGIYVRTSSTVLTRTTDYDSDSEISGGDFVFVVSGTLYNSTGWVQIDPVNVVGTDPIEWEQFSGAGTYLPGEGLSLVGNEFNVNLSTTGGLEFSGSNAIQLKNTIAGDGLTLTEGVIAAVGTTNRITVTADAIDISENYVGQSSITTVGTINSGTWQGTVISPTWGGTGVNNGTNTITLGGNLTISGSHTLTLTTTANTSVTLPTTGTLATLAGAETLTNKTLTSPVITSPTLTGGTINNTVIGGTTAASANFTSVGMSGNLTGSGTSVLSGFDIDGGTY